MSTAAATYGGQPVRKRGARLRLPFRVKVEAIVLGVFATLAYLFVLAPMVVVIGASLHGRGFYTAAQFPPTSRIAIPIVLSAITYVMFNYAGIKAHGAGAYFKEMIDPAPDARGPT